MSNSENEEIRRAAQLEQRGDEAASQGLSAAAYYLESQRVLLPVGVVWSDREAYTTRKEGFDRLQEKLYALDGSGRARKAEAVETAPAPSVSAIAPLASTGAELSVWQFYPGLTVRVVQGFRDYDGQDVCAGEVLRFLGSSYFFYDGGHTLNFEGRTIRLADVVAEHQAIIANAGNAWFLPLDG